MDRRTLLVGLGAAATWLSLSGCARFAHNGRLPGSSRRPGPTTPLSNQLTELADPHFRDYSAGRSVEALLSEMARKGVISARHGINHEKLASIARYEPIIIYKGSYYTQTELELYTLAVYHSRQ